MNVARSFNPYGTREQILKRFDELPGKDKLGGPTGVGDDWVRVGPIKLFLDGGMLNGTAYMRQPWPKGPTYQVTTDDYRGLLFIPQEQLRMIVGEGVKRKWQMTAHTAGEGAMDELLDAYEFVNRITPINDCGFASRTPTSRPSTISSAARSSASSPTCSRPGFTRTAPRS